MKFLTSLMLGASLFSSAEAMEDSLDHSKNPGKISGETPKTLIKVSKGVPTEEKKAKPKIQIWKNGGPQKAFLDFQNGKYISSGKSFPSSSQEFESAVKSIQTGEGWTSAQNVKPVNPVSGVTDTSVHYNSKLGERFLRGLSIFNKFYRDIHLLNIKNLKELFIDNYGVKKSHPIDLRQFLNLSKFGVAHPLGVVKVTPNLKELTIFLLNPASFIYLAGKSQTQKIDIFSDGRTLNSILLKSRLFPSLQEINYFIKGVSTTRDPRRGPWCGLGRFLEFGGIFPHLRSFTFSKSCLRADSSPILSLDLDALEGIMPNLSELTVKGLRYIEGCPSEVRILKKEKAPKGFSLKKLDLKDVDYYDEDLLKLLNLAQLEDVYLDLEEIYNPGPRETANFDKNREFLIEGAPLLKSFKTSYYSRIKSFKDFFKIFSSWRHPSKQSEKLHLHMPIIYSYENLNPYLSISGQNAVYNSPWGTLEIELQEKENAKQEQKAIVKSFTPTPTPTLKTLIESGKWLRQGENPKDLYFRDLESYFPEEQYKGFLESLSDELTREGVVPLEIDVGPHNFKIEYHREKEGDWGIIKGVERCPTLEELIKEASGDDLKIESLRGRKFSLSQSFWQNIKFFTPDSLSRVEVNNLSISCFLLDNQYGLFGHIKNVKKLPDFKE